MMWRRLSLMAIMSVFCATAHGKETAAAQRLSARERQAVLQAVEAAIAKNYVFPDLRAKIIERLEQAQRAGRYDDDDSRVFAARVTEDLRADSHDRHLSLRADPAAYAAAMAPEDSDDGESAFQREGARQDHHGLAELKILPGNIRYLRITEFEWIDDETGRVYDDTMRFLKDGDAVVIDIRGNPGGSHAAVRYLVSHFMDGDVFEMTFLAGSETPEQSRTLEYLPAGRLKGKPLYVLIDDRDASAAEAFAYDVKQFKLGQLVGVKTAGAANNNKLLPIAPAFILSVSYGRPVHAVSQTNWEGVGIAPDVEATSRQALDVAEAVALKQLSETPGASRERLAAYAWAQTAVDVRLHPAVLAPAALKAWVGHYGKPNVGFGQVEVAFRDGSLWLIRPDRPLARLSPLTTDGLFAIEGSEMLRARLTRATLELLWATDPEPHVFLRQ